MRQFQLLLLLTFLFAKISLAQTSVVGIWQGTINAGLQLRLVFHISADSTGKLITVMDSPDQNSKGFPTSGTSIKGDSLIIEVSSVNGRYAGKIKNSSTINGEWSQGKLFPLDLKKVDHVEELIRPQTPKPPFPYKSDSVEYDGANTKLQYGATITIPNGRGPFPALVMITGSGQQGRDEDLLGHRPFAVIADYLTKNGYVVLRVDDRGKGKSTGDFENSTSQDFANDVEESLNYLNTRKEVNHKKIGLIGHSEGGMIAPMVAIKRKDVSFIVLLAGPGVKITQLMTEQNGAILESVGIVHSASEKFLSLYKSMIEIIPGADSKETAKEKVNQLVTTWQQQTPSAAVRATTGIYDDSSRNKYVNTIVDGLYNPWFRFFLGYDPAPAIQKLSCKVLALNGSKDVQVISKSNLAGIDSALKKSKSPSYKTQELPGLNHLFQHCKSCQLAEYGKLEETFSPEALDIIRDWLNKEVK
ncbi:MAG: alpha/beta hydrolase [Bacteroidetes bacterium]|nr:MAG: alpha/beta hydrolase [Bacteroidota bacterium]